MESFNNTEVKKQINNLVAMIKAHYPHLYEETGGKFIRKILRGMLETTDAATYYTNSSSSMVELKQNYSSNGYLDARVLKHKRTQQKAA